MQTSRRPESSPPPASPFVLSPTSPSRTGREMAIAAGPRTLPARAYRDPGVYELEREQLFRTEWLLVAASEQLRRPGDYVAVDIAEEPVMVVRGPDGVVRALSSVCRHRYMLLTAPGSSGHTDCFVCPYHGWRYDRRGRLTGAPMMAATPGFRRGDHDLVRFAAEEWEGLVFVNLDRDAPPLAPRLEPVRSAFTRFDMAHARQVAFDDRWWRANWKIAVENASECYHHFGTHRELLDGLLPAWGTYGAPGSPAFAVHHTPVAAGADWGLAQHGVTGGLLPADTAETVIFTIFPSTLVLNAGPLIGWFSFLPRGVDEVRFLNGFLAPPALDAAGAVDPAEVTRLMLAINDQDEPIVEGCQIGVRSASTPPGLLSSKEPSLAPFYAYLRTALRDATGHPPY